MVGGEVEKLVRRNWPPLLVKKTSALSLDSQGSDKMTKAIGR